MNTRTMTRPALVAVVLTTAVTATAQAHRIYAETLDTTVTLDRQATVDISLLSGRVDIVGGGGSQARVRARSDRGDIQFDANSGRIQLSVDPRRRGSGWARL